MFRWGVISATAPIATGQMIPAIQRAAGSVVSGVSSRALGRAREIAARFAIPHAFGDHAELLASDQIDGVYIAAPTAFHTDLTLQAIAAGKHVLCEKPIALAASEIDRLIAARDESGLLVSEAFMVMYHPQWHKVRDLLSDGAIGRLRHVQGVFTYPNFDADSTRNRVEMGGGGLLDIGVYPAVTTRFVTRQEPQRVQASVERDPRFGTDTFSSVKADFGDFELSFYCSTQMALRQEMTFHGEAGYITVHTPFNAPDFGDMAVTVFNADHDRAEVFRFPGVHQYQREAETFAAAAMGGPEEVFTLEMSRANQAAIDAMFRAGDAEGWVPV